MEIVSNDEVTSAYDVFCKELGFDHDKMANCYEFSTFIGFALINQFKYVNNDEGIIVKPKVPAIIAALNGPHGVTVVRAWKARRYSFTGRLRALWLKPAHRIGFALVSFAAFVKEAIS